VKLPTFEFVKILLEAAEVVVGPAVAVVAAAVMVVVRVHAPDPVAVVAHLATSARILPTHVAALVLVPETAVNFPTHVCPTVPRYCTISDSTSEM